MQAGAVTAECSKTCRKSSKIISVCLTVVSLGFIIGGAVLIAKNSGTGRLGEPFDDVIERHNRYGGGIALVSLGAFFLVISLMLCCLAFQLKFLGRVAEEHSGRFNEQPHYPYYTDQAKFPPAPPYPGPPSAAPPYPVPSSSVPPYPVPPSAPPPFLQ